MVTCIKIHTNPTSTHILLDCCINKALLLKKLSSQMNEGSLYERNVTSNINF